MGQRGNGAGGWWLWVITGVVVTIGAVMLLEPWFRVSSSAALGWGAFAAASFDNRRRADVRSPALWGMSAVVVLLLVGLTLLLGAAGLGNDEGRTDSVVPGAVLGGVLFAAGALGLLVLRVLQRRKAVSDEVERHRAEHTAPTTTTTTTTTTGAAADDLS
jgi:hypothetical protein